MTLVTLTRIMISAHLVAPTGASCTGVTQPEPIGVPSLPLKVLRAT